MKYRYVGEDDCFCIELLAFKLVPKDKYLKKGQIIDVPNDLTRVINSLDESGLFEKVQTNKKVTKTKKSKKGKK